MITNTWNNCYPSNWKGVIVPDAMAHPAKYSSKLIRRIYQHMQEEGWVNPGDHVLDPFGGVALGALEAMKRGLHWTGNELEEKFFYLGNANIAKWMNEYGHMPRLGSARLLHGDSRFLLEVIGGAVQVSVSSPPFTDTVLHDGGPALQQGGVLHSDYGNTPGQLGSMKAQGFDAAISSPPFLQSEGGTPEPKPGGAIDEALYKRHAAGNAAANGYGKTDGQLSSMKGDGFEVAVSSPPFNANDRNTKHGGSKAVWANGTDSMARLKKDYIMAASDGNLGNASMDSFDAAVSSPPYDEARVGKESGQEHCGTGDQYGETEGQLGGSDDFWLAARTIVEQVYQALTPGGHAVWVVKDYVKNKQIVPFSDQWRQLCEAVGFVTLHEHRAMLVHHKGTQQTLDGGAVEYKTESKSFFRRLAEKKGSPRIDWETVYCMVKK